MTFANELIEKRQKALEDIALNLANKVKVELEKVAESGGSEYAVFVEAKDKYLMSDEFIEMLSLLLEGVKIEAMTNTAFLTTNRYLNFSF